MKASIVDLRYKMKEILKALRRNETVHILYHGKEAGIILPSSPPPTREMKTHPLFGIRKREKETVEEKMKRLRGDRYNAL